MLDEPLPLLTNRTIAEILLRMIEYSTEYPNWHSFHHFFSEYNRHLRLFL
ncbi:MAG: hypothetical protein JWR61_5156 [Ferruginibacter sp.]|nr:hypothetical protein [Ferruginibacter sp.]